MAEALDIRPWQAAVDPALLAHLRRPLRRSAAVDCAWARQALARARLGGLPMFDSWTARWGLRAADVSAMHPLVYAQARGEQAPPMRPPSVAAQPAPAAPRPTVTATPMPRTSEPASAALVAPRATHLAPPAPAGHDPRAIDLRVDPGRLATSQASPVPTAPTIVQTTATDRGASEPAAPRRRPPRTRVVTTWDLAREQARPTPADPSPLAPIVRPTIAAAPHAQPTPAAPTVQVARPTTTPLARDLDPSSPAASPTPVPRELAPPRLVARELGSPGPVAAPTLIAHEVARDDPAPLPVARPRVHARPIAAPVLPVLSDSLGARPSARPRVALASTPASPSPPALVAPAPAAGLDLGLPTAVAARVAASPSPLAAAPAPVAAPVRPVVTSPAALDIPAIAEAVHRHLERQLRWERERRGGRA